LCRYASGCQLPDGTFEPWICSRKQIKINEDSRIFSPANMRAGAELPGYKKLMDHYIDNKYTLRYTGGLVPDVYQQFTKNMGRVGTFPLVRTWHPWGALPGARVGTFTLFCSQNTFT
jgi:fructose-1,6-bisphosphatase